MVTRASRRAPPVIGRRPRRLKLTRGRLPVAFTRGRLPVAFTRGRLPVAFTRGRLPLVALVVVSLASLGARAAWLGAPCRAPCRTGRSHVLIFDERYYVNAARVIAGIHPPAGATYADAPLGVDPNAEHAPLAKLIVAGSIELLGDRPLAWRMGSLLLGTLAILGMFALIRAAGAGRWQALAGAGLMAADNLMIVHGRIFTLDIYALAAMVWAAAAYLRGRPLLAGVLAGVGACAKLVAVYVLIALALYEALEWWRWRDRPARRAGRVAGCVAVAAGVFVGLLALLDRFAPPYDPVAHRLVAGGVFGEIHHILAFAAAQTSPGGPAGIASYPWRWLVDYKPIVYLNINPARPAPGLYHIHPAVHFLGLISPPILLLALPALMLAGVRTARRGDRLARVAVAWTAGTFLPFVLFSLAFARTSYLYYMVVVMPGLYAAVAWLLPRIWHRRRLVGLWLAMVVLAAVIAYPLTPLP
jgi:predicted membrane-bound dolichyl-phosphate-mannose-protein mannosyltransferase